MDVKGLVAKLHPLERQVLPVLSREQELPGIAQSAGIQEVEVRRALQWLEQKKAVTLQEQKLTVVSLGTNGLRYHREGLPEQKFLKAVNDQWLPLDTIAKNSGLLAEEVHVCLGLLRGKGAIDLQQGKTLLVKRTVVGKKLIQQGFPEEQFLQRSFPCEVSTLSSEEKRLVEELRKRKQLITIEERRSQTVALTTLGRLLIKENLTQPVLNRLTSSLLKTGQWKQQQFRGYDLEGSVPKIYPGRKHFVSEAVEYARKIWLDMGFQEMTGPLVATSFWNFDALFTAQDHPVRELQDTFYVGQGKLPADKQLIQRVKAMHEHGDDIPSKGWQYHWNPEDAQRTVLRTHTTVLSSHTLAQLKKEDLPQKFFALGKCFRNEALDWSHLFEFNQTEGIVIDRQANFSHLLGYLKVFFNQMGFPQARFRPAYFPYTEPSVEIEVFHPVHQKWMELGGAGMFRPEVVIPLLGEEIPVLAWGPGFDRMILDYHGLTDIRDLYRNDIQQLREVKTWLR